MDLGISQANKLSDIDNEGRFTFSESSRFRIKLRQEYCDKRYSEGVFITANFNFVDLNIQINEIR